MKKRNTASAVADPRQEYARAWANKVLEGQDWTVSAYTPVWYGMGYPKGTCFVDIFNIHGKYIGQLRFYPDGQTEWTNWALGCGFSCTESVSNWKS